MLCKNQGCGVGGKISDSNSDFDLFKISDSNSGFSTFPTPTFPKFLNPTPQHTGKEIWLLKSMEIVVHSKEALFLQKFQKNCVISPGIPVSGVSCKKSSNWTSGVGQKIPTSTPSVARNPTPTPPKILRLLTLRTPV